MLDFLLALAGAVLEEIDTDELAADVLVGIAEGMWDGYWEGLAEAQRLAELQALAQAPQPQVQQAVTAVVQKVAADKPPQVRQRLTTYLTQVPALVRQATRRPTDPSGVTVPPYLRLQKAQDLLPFLPSRMPRFQSGQRPIPGVDLELVELLGMGGFGEVWKAKNPLLPNMPPVALKFCLDAVATKSLRHEAAVLDRVMRQGKHPGIVELRHTYLSADPPCLEYEYVEGGDLAGLIQEWHRSKGGLSPEQAAKLIHRLAEIVAFAHRLAPAIVHRDLKPANILVKKTKENKITFRVADFGLGGVAAEHVIRKTRLGNTRDLLLTKSFQGAYTPLYASPQQMRGDPPDPRDDVYALGIIWYQMLTGDLTTGAPSGLQWTKPLMQRGMSEPLVRLLAACFEGKAEDRPASAAVLADKLAAQIKEGGEIPWVQPVPTVTASPKRTAEQRAEPPLPPAKTQPAKKPSSEQTAPWVGMVPGSSTAGTDIANPPRKLGNARKGSPVWPWLIAGVTGLLGIVAVLLLLMALSSSNPPRTPLAKGGPNGSNFPTAPQEPTRTSRASSEVAEQFYKQGIAASQRADYNGAIVAFTRAIQSDPSYSLAFSQRADAYRNLGRFDEAIADCTSALALDRDNTSALGVRGYCYVWKQDAGKAINDLNQALQVSPQYAFAYFSRGDAYRLQGNYLRAIDDYCAGIKLDQRMANSWKDNIADVCVRQGEIYLQQGQHDLAVVVANMALAAEPNQYQAYCVRGQAKSALGQHASAIEDYTTAIRVNASLPRAYLGRALANQSRQYHDLAITDFTSAITADRGNPSLYVYRAGSYIEKKQFDLAISDSTVALKLNPNLDVALNIRGNARSMKGMELLSKNQLNLGNDELGRAIADYTEAIRLNPKDAYSYEGRAFIQLTWQRFREAIADLTEAIRINPQNAFAFKLRGDAHIGLGDRARACNGSA